MKNFFNDKNLVGNPFFCWLELFVAVMLFWIILSGIFNFQFLTYGVLSSLVISLVCLNSFKMRGIRTDRSYFVLNVNYLKLICYFIWLIKEIMMSSINVASLVFDGKINSQIIWFKADYDNPYARALLANSITLTPGTVTIDISEDGIYSVHALDDSSGKSLLVGTMQKAVADLFNDPIHFEVLEAETVESVSTPMAHLVSKRFRGRSKAL